MYDGMQNYKEYGGMENYKSVANIDINLHHMCFIRDSQDVS